MATLKRTALKTATVSKRTPASSVVATTTASRSSLELRVLPSFDPRVKLLVEMMSRIDVAIAKDHSVPQAKIAQVRENVQQALAAVQGELKAAGLIVNVSTKGGDARPKTLEERVADFKSTAARIIKGKHPDFIGWLRLDQEALAKHMIDYIDFFYGDDKTKPGTALTKKIGKMLEQADQYFEDILNRQPEGGGNVQGFTSGLHNIEQFLGKVAKA